MSEFLRMHSEKLLSPFHGFKPRPFAALQSKPLPKVANEVGAKSNYLTLLTQEAPNPGSTPLVKKDSTQLNSTAIELLNVNMFYVSGENASSIGSPNIPASHAEAECCSKAYPYASGAAPPPPTMTSNFTPARMHASYNLLGRTKKVRGLAQTIRLPFTWFLKWFLPFILFLTFIQSVTAQATSSTSGIVPTSCSTNKAPALPFDLLSTNCTSTMGVIAYSWANLLSYSKAVSQTTLDTSNKPIAWCIFNNSVNNNNYFSDGGPNCTPTFLNYSLPANNASSQLSAVYSAGSDPIQTYCLYLGGANPFYLGTSTLFNKLINTNIYLSLMAHLNFDRFGYVCASNWPTGSGTPLSYSNFWTALSGYAFITYHTMLNSPRIAQGLDLSGGWPNYSPPFQPYILTWTNPTNPAYNFVPQNTIFPSVSIFYTGFLLYYVVYQDPVDLPLYMSTFSKIYPPSINANIAYNFASHLGYTSVMNVLLTDPLTNLYSNIQSGSYCNVRLLVQNCLLNVSAQLNFALALADSPNSYPDIARLIYNAPTFVNDGSPMVSSILSKYSLNVCNFTTSITTLCPTITTTTCSQVSNQTCTPLTVCQSTTTTQTYVFPPTNAQSSSVVWTTNSGDYVPLAVGFYNEIASKYSANVTGSGYGDGIYKTYVNLYYKGDDGGNVCCGGIISAPFGYNGGSDSLVLASPIKYFLHSWDYINPIYFSYYLEIPISIVLKQYTVAQTSTTYSPINGGCNTFTSWNLYASNDLISWPQVDSQTGTSGWLSKTSQTYNVANTSPYLAFKFTVPGQVYLCIYRIRYFGFPVSKTVCAPRAICPNIPANAPLYPYDSLNYNCTTIMTGINYNWTNLVYYAGLISSTSLDTVNPPKVWCIFNYSVSNNNYFPDSPNCASIISNSYSNNLTYDSLLTASTNLDNIGIWCLYAAGANPFSPGSSYFQNLFFPRTNANAFVNYLGKLFHFNFDRFGYICGSNWATGSSWPIIYPAQYYGAGSTVSAMFFGVILHNIYYGDVFVLLNSPRIAPYLDFSTGFCNNYYGPCYSDPPYLGIFYSFNTMLNNGDSFGLAYTFSWNNPINPAFNFNPGLNYIAVLIYYVTNNYPAYISTFTSMYPSYPLSGFGNIAYNTAVKIGNTIAASLLLMDPLVQFYASIQSGNYCAVQLYLRNCSLNISAQYNLGLAFADSPISYPDIVRLIYNSAQFLKDGSAVVSTLVSKYSLSFCASTSVTTNCPIQTQTFASCPKVTTTCISPTPFSSIIYTASGSLTYEFPPTAISTMPTPWPSSYTDFVPLNSFIFPEIAHKYIANVSGSGYGDGIYKVYANHEFEENLNSLAGAPFNKNNMSSSYQFLMVKGCDFFVHWNNGTYQSLLQSVTFDLYLEVPILIFLSSYSIQSCFSTGCSYGITLTSWTLYGSNNSLTWNVIDSRTGASFTNANYIYSYSILSLNPYNVFKFSTPYSPTPQVLSQLRFFGTPAIISRIIPPSCSC